MDSDQGGVCPCPYPYPQGCRNGRPWYRRQKQADTGAENNPLIIPLSFPASVAKPALAVQCQLRLSFFSQHAHSLTESRIPGRIR